MHPVAARTPQVLYEQANETCRLKAALAAMRESELDLAAQDADDNARHMELLVRDAAAGSGVCDRHTNGC